MALFCNNKRSKSLSSVIRLLLRQNVCILWETAFYQRRSYRYKAINRRSFDHCYRNFFTPNQNSWMATILSSRSDILSGAQFAPDFWNPLQALNIVQTGTTLNTRIQGLKYWFSLWKPKTIFNSKDKYFVKICFNNVWHCHNWSSPRMFSMKFLRLQLYNYLPNIFVSSSRIFFCSCFKMVAKKYD